MSADAPAAAFLELRGLTRRLPSGGRLLTIIDGIDLRVARGEFLAVLGPSGSGKSTLLALMAGLDRPDEGEVWIAGEPIQDLSEDRLALLRRHRVGFVFQSFQLLGNLTARENVLLPLELLDVRDAGERVDTPARRRRPRRPRPPLPGAALRGEQQRVALARAFASRPPLLLADEPTGNLDSATGERVLDTLSELRRREGSTLVLVTHDPAVARRADRRVHLRDGRVEREEVGPGPTAGAGG